MLRCIYIFIYIANERLLTRSFQFVPLTTQDCQTVRTFNSFPSENIYGLIESEKNV